MQIRRLGPADAETARDAIVALKPDRRPGELTVEYMREFLSNASNHLLVASEAGEPVGFALAYRLERIDQSRPMLFLYEIGTAKTHRGQGVGAALVEQLKLICREIDAVKMWVETNRSNTAAMALYHSTGGIPDASGDQVSFLYYP